MPEAVTAIHEALRLGLEQLHAEHRFEDWHIADAPPVPGTLVQDSYTGRTWLVVVRDWDKVKELLAR